MNPFDDLHRFHRPAALIVSSMNGAEIEPLIEWLHPRYDLQNDTEYSEEDLSVFKALGVDKPPRRS